MTLSLYDRAHNSFFPINLAADVCSTKYIVMSTERLSSGAVQSVISSKSFASLELFQAYILLYSLIFFYLIFRLFLLNLIKLFVDIDDFSVIFFSLKYRYVKQPK